MKKSNLFKVFLGFTLLAFTSCDDDDMMDMDKHGATLFVTSNATGDINTYAFKEDGGVEMNRFTTLSTGNEGIHYDEASDDLIVASRSALQVNVYGGVSNVLMNPSLSLDLGGSGAADLMNPRAMAVNGNTMVIADNQQNQFFVYTKSGNSLTLKNTFDIDFAVWGIEFIGDDLFAVVDKTADLAVFNNFSSNTSDGMLQASKKVTIEGIERTHGLAYDRMKDMMVMTDIGDAENTEDDGGFHLIENFSSTFNNTSDGGTIGMAAQIRVAGAATMMGNPIDVAYDSESGTVYIAEIGNGGGRVLAFSNYENGGNVSPSWNVALGGASSLYLATD
ncbi:hypothetical protein [uncultured Cyclobacterium sp.]|mgnify:CR=1 FL=1|uniref:hypothetical protein n=1 Tax=uncultured Cyclobacterium sp. TaxID=453820 RepID=UPI0030EB1407|tara:strand:+ start:42707 stop:43708 length:1002 start_codon:yes stop_codon:yes gene_type:complete